MLGHRLRRWPNIETKLGQRLVFAGIQFSPSVSYHLDHTDNVDGTTDISGERDLSAIITGTLL